jgi:hypothetical protein
MNIFIVLIISPDGDIEVELAVSRVHAKNIILNYQRYEAYYDYTFEIVEKYLDLSNWRILCG